MNKKDLEALVQECISEVMSEGYDEFQRADKGSKGVAAKDKAEEDTYGAGYAAGEKAAKAKYKKLAEAYKQLKEEGFGLGPKGLDTNDDLDEAMGDENSGFIGPENVDRLYKKGLELFRQGQTEDAEKIRKKILATGRLFGWGEKEYPKYDLDEAAGSNKVKHPMFDKLVKHYMGKGHSEENAKKQAAADINAGDRSGERSEKSTFNYNESQELDEARVSQDNVVNYLVNVLQSVWNAGKGNNSIDFQDFAQSLYFDMFGDDEMNEARFPKGTDIGKPGKGFEKIAKAAEKRYGSKEAGQKVAGAILKKVIKKENIHNTAQMGGVTTSKGTAGYIDNPDKKGGDYDPKARAANLAKLAKFGSKK
jgi:hypothetical protein